ncbi:flagellin [Clostridium rectalis]|uniref:flagellin N-terminal helical domain-containing protein n=1 Tax=Clostridium rectalis TaxID=2040295 RepID=UPI000F63B67A|nr:flagellin [Clostridium rectalis]
MRLNHNLTSLNIYREYGKNLKSQSTALSRISSGLKIIKSGDDPNKIAKSERMRLQVRGLQMAQRNVQDGASMMQTADGALSSINSILLRIRELSVQSGSGSNSDSDKEEIKNEINEMVETYKDIVNNTEFNGVKLFKSEQEKPMQIGSDVGEVMDIKFYDLSADKVGVYKLDNNGTKVIDDNKTLESLKKMDPKEKDFANRALEIVDAVSEKVVDTRSKYGALSNKFESTYKNLGEFEEITQRNESSLRDADIAEEMMDYAKTSILIDAGNAMMAQSNKFPQDMLRILENVRTR